MVPVTSFFNHQSLGSLGPVRRGGRRQAGERVDSARLTSHWGAAFRGIQQGIPRVLLMALGAKHKQKKNTRFTPVTQIDVLNVLNVLGIDM